MARSLTDLQTTLSDLTGLPSEKVYIEQPQSIPDSCIIIEHSAPDSNFRADNVRYRFLNGYTIIVIDRDTESPLPGQVASLPYSSFDRVYKLNGLYHFAYRLFF